MTTIGAGASLATRLEQAVGPRVQALAELTLTAAGLALAASLIAFGVFAWGWWSGKPKQWSESGGARALLGRAWSPLSLAIGALLTLFSAASLLTLVVGVPVLFWNLGVVRVIYPWLEDGGAGRSLAVLAIALPTIAIVWLVVAAGKGCIRFVMFMNRDGRHPLVEGTYSP